MILPHGAELHMGHNGHQYSGTINDGEWAVEENRSKNPSTTTSGVALTKDGKYMNLDGWNYWYAKRPSDTEWITIKQLRYQINNKWLAASRVAQGNVQRTVE